MSFNQAANGAPNLPSNTDPMANEDLEAHLRAMVLNHQKETLHEPATHTVQSSPPSHHGQRGQHRRREQTVPFLGPMADATQFPHQTTQTSGLPPTFPINANFLSVTQGLPPPGFYFPGDYTNAPVPQIPYQIYPGPPPGLQTAGLPPQTGLQYSPSQLSAPQPQSPNMSPSTPPRQEYIPPHMRHIYKQQSQRGSPHQHPPQMMPVHQPQVSPRGHNNYPRNIPSIPPSAALEHFPPLGTQPAKINYPPPNLYTSQPTAQKSQRIQYQPLPINTRNFNPQARGGQTRGGFRAPNYAGRPPQQFIEQVSAEQSHHLNEFSKRIIAEAAPPESETSVKHALLKRLEVICKEVSSDAKLIPFGSLVTGFATANSDLDVIFTIGSQSGESSDDLSSPDFKIPHLLESKLQEEGFDATLLTKTRVPILKIVQNPTEESPFELHCDIGFSNHLAVFNTNMLSTYSKCDPRVKQMMIFIKWWAKKRHINNPYRGTLSSYGYSLIVLHYLINIVKPPVLPNLQAFPTSEDTPTAEIVFEAATGDDIFEIWFYKAIDTLPKSSNTMHIGELLRGFFEYYAYAFQWGREVVSIRTKGGLLTKQEKGWVAAVIRPGKVENSEVKDRYLFAVEDPFEIEHNVSRTCNAPGVARIKEEFRRAVRLIRYRDGGKTMSECLCMEAPPERPWVRREDRDRVGQGGGGDNLGEGQKRETGGIGEGNLEEVKADVHVGNSQKEELKYEGPTADGILVKDLNTP